MDGKVSMVFNRNCFSKIKDFSRLGAVHAASFTEDVRSLVKVMEELGNPSEEDSPDLVALDTKEIVGSPAIEAVRKVTEIGLNQFQAFTFSPGIAL